MLFKYIFLKVLIDKYRISQKRKGDSAIITNNTINNKLKRLFIKGKRAIPESTNIQTMLYKGFLPKNPNTNFIACHNTIAMLKHNKEDKNKLVLFRKVTKL